MPNLKQSLIDFKNEMSGRLIEETYEVEKRTWTLRLLSDEEETWSMGLIDFTNEATVATSSRRSLLAIGIRSIDGCLVGEAFEEEWLHLSDEERIALANMNKYAHKYFVAEHLYSYLSDLPGEVIHELWAKWADLVSRRKEAQSMSKKS